AASRIRISFTPLAHGAHRLPVVRFLAALYLVELMACLAFGLSLLTAGLFHRWIERPAGRLGRR
ncbi:MAG: hypothetical protein KDI64_00670, partial [Candidatus Accumulibacter sp.]|nr:hypothetical protein [Accumulibacter sp.]